MTSCVTYVCEGKWQNTCVSLPSFLLHLTCPCVDFWFWCLLCRLNHRSCLMNGCPSCVTIDSIGKTRLPCTLMRSPSTSRTTPPPTPQALLRVPLSERYTVHCSAHCWSRCDLFNVDSNLNSLNALCFLSANDYNFYLQYLLQWKPS